MLLCWARGSPCALPEETIAGYEKAAMDGADYLELDVVRRRLLLLVRAEEGWHSTQACCPSTDVVYR